MKKSRLKDVLDKDSKQNDWIVDKFLKLQARMHAKNPSIDDFSLRWVDRKIVDYKNGIISEKVDLEKANKLWKEWK